MNGQGTKMGCEYREPTPEESEHIMQHHIKVMICTTDGTARIVVNGECGDGQANKHGHRCPIVDSFVYCKRPPC
jgi:hypothetical protein